MTRDNVLTVIMVVVIIAIGCALLEITKPACRPGERAVLPRYGGWVCARTP